MQNILLIIRTITSFQESIQSVKLHHAHTSAEYANVNISTQIRITDIFSNITIVI